MNSNGARATDTVGFKVMLVAIGALLSFIVWIGQCAIMDQSKFIRSQEQAIDELNVRMTKIEVLIPEIKEALCEIKEDLKILLRK